MRYLATVALLAVACTAHNPDYTGGGGGGGGGSAGGGGGMGGDLAGTPPPADLAGTNVDLAGPMGPCTAGQRQCAGIVASDRCEGGMFVVDRVCPASSSCMNDYCAPPTPMVGTQVGLRCDANGGAQQLQCMASAAANLSCQPFVDANNHNVHWFCDSAVGAGRAGTKCTKGSECRSGVCAVNAGVCFDACQQSQDCTLIAPNLTCQQTTIVVEGVTVNGKSCR